MSTTFIEQQQFFKKKQLGIPSSLIQPHKHRPTATGNYNLVHSIFLHCIFWYNGHEMEMLFIFGAQPYIFHNKPEYKKYGLLGNKYGPQL